MLLTFVRPSGNNLTALAQYAAEHFTPSMVKIKDDAGYDRMLPVGMFVNNAPAQYRALVDMPHSATAITKGQIYSGVEPAPGCLLVACNDQTVRLIGSKHFRLVEVAPSAAIATPDPAEPTPPTTEKDPTNGIQNEPKPKRRGRPPAARVAPVNGD